MSRLVQENRDNSPILSQRSLVCSLPLSRAHVNSHSFFLEISNIIATFAREKKHSHMKRQLLTFLLLFCTVLTALSQGDSSGQHTIGYCTDDLSGAEAIGLGDGQERVSAAIPLPRSLMMRYQGTRITRLRFAVRNGLQDASVWIRSSLTTSSRVVQSVSQLSDGWNEVVLNQPLTVDGEEL